MPGVSPEQEREEIKNAVVLFTHYYLLLYLNLNYFFFKKKIPIEY